MSTWSRDNGDLSLIKGVMMQVEDPRGHAFKKTRRFRKHMQYDKDIGHFVATDKRKQNRVTVGYLVDADNHRILQGMLDKADRLSETMIQNLPNKVVNREMEQLLPTNLTRFTRDKKSLCVLGAVPVIITIGC